MSYLLVGGVDGTRAEEGVPVGDPRVFVAVVVGRSLVVVVAVAWHAEEVRRGEERI